MPAARPPDRITVSAPAKINLFLHVGAKRADGFHDLESLVAFAGVGDTLTFERADRFSLSITGPFASGISDGADNLVMKAARLLAARTGVKQGARIALDKRLPVASGIGGGSADAAATLRGLSVLWGLDIAMEELQSIAVELGSDVPVCLASTPALIAGRGEKITPVPPLPDCWLVLVNPRIPVSTAEVFAKLDRSHPPLEGGSKFAQQISGRSESSSFAISPSPKNSSNFSTLPQGGGGNALVEFLQSTSNDLEAPARHIAPVIDDVLEEIARQKDVLFTRMSGSGATCFGIFSEEAAARAAADSINSNNRNWWAAAARSITASDTELGD